MDKVVINEMRLEDIACVHDYCLRKKTLKIRVDLIKELVLANFMSRYRRSNKFELSEKEYIILKKLCEKVAEQLDFFEFWCKPKPGVYYDLKFVIDAIYLENGELLVINEKEKRPKNGDKIAKAKELRDIFEEEKEGGIYTYHVDPFFVEEIDEDSKREWIIRATRNNLQGLKNTCLKKEIFIPMPDYIKNGLLSYINRVRCYFHKPYLSMNRIHKLVLNYKELYHQNEINAISNFLTIEEYIDARNVFLDVLFIYPGTSACSREEAIICDFIYKFFREFTEYYASESEKIREMVEQRKNDKLDAISYNVDKNDERNERLKKENDYFYNNKLTYLESKFIHFSVKLRNYDKGILSMGNKTFELINDDFIKKGRDTLYRIKYLKNVSYTIDGIKYEILKGMLGGYISKKAFVLEDVIIFPEAKVLAYVFLGSGIVIDNGVTVNRCTKIYNYNFKVDEKNVESFFIEKFGLKNEEVEFLEM